MSGLEQVSKEMMDELEHLTILRNRGDDFLDTATRIKENENDEYDNIIEFTRNQLASEEEVQAKILNYVHFGDPQFEAEKPKKWVVKSKYERKDGRYHYLLFTKSLELRLDAGTYVEKNATRFDTKEEAERWTNPDTEAVEVEE